MWLYRTRGRSHVHTTLAEAYTSALVSCDILPYEKNISFPFLQLKGVRRGGRNAHTRLASDFRRVLARVRQSRFKVDSKTVGSPCRVRTLKLDKQGIWAQRDWPRGLMSLERHGRLQPLAVQLSPQSHRPGVALK